MDNYSNFFWRANFLNAYSIMFSCIEICERGEYLVDKVCMSCDVDYYQPMFMPDSSVRCTKCPNIGDTPQGTEGMKSENVTDCKRKSITSFIAFS